MPVFESKADFVEFLDQTIKNKEEFLSYQTKKLDIARQEGMLKALKEIRTLVVKKVPGWKVVKKESIDENVQ